MCGERLISSNGFLYNFSARPECAGRDVGVLSRLPLPRGVILGRKVGQGLYCYNRGKGYARFPALLSITSALSSPRRFSRTHRVDRFNVDKPH